MAEVTSTTETEGARFRTTLIRVMVVQVIALGLLLLLQLRYNV